MRRRVPLNAVRAFEAAARHLNLVRAADELCVTPTAVSHQIRQLEEFLQFKLFVRRNNRLELTPESRLCLERLSGALDTIDDALKALAPSTQQREHLSIGTSVSVASMWLMPRLQRFLRVAPDVDVSVLTYLNRREIEMRQPDLWICNWDPDQERYYEPFIEEEIIPVVSPILADKYGPLSFKSLKTIPLIHTDRNVSPAPNTGRYPSWERYLAENGISRQDAAIGPRFNQGSAAVDAAKAGLGAVLGRSILIWDALANGELVQIGEPYPVRNTYYLAYDWNNGSRAVGKFKEWLFDQIGPRRLVSSEVR